PIGVVAGGHIPRILELIREHEVERVVVGLPVTLRGEIGEQARETQAFIDALRSASGIEVVPFDEPFTTDLPEQTPSPSPHGAAHRLTSYLVWASARA